MQKKKRERLATACLIIATFLNPFGFDAVQSTLIRLTGSYWSANLVMYFLAGCFFGLYFLFSGNNPILATKDIIVSVYYNTIKKKK